MNQIDRYWALLEGSRQGIYTGSEVVGQALDLLALALSSHGPNQALQKLTCAISLKVQGKHEGDVNGQKAK
jgi:hypothetical protein